MLYSIDQIETGISSYLDNEFLAQYPNNSVEKVLIGTGLALLIKTKKDQAISVIKNLGAVSEDGEVDVDLLSEELKRHMTDDGIVFEKSIFGNVWSIKIKKEDIDKLCSYIKK